MCDAEKFNLERDESMLPNASDSSVFYAVIQKVEEKLIEELRNKKGKPQT